MGQLLNLIHRLLYAASALLGHWAALLGTTQGMGLLYFFYPGKLFVAGGCYSLDKTGYIPKYLP
jgi:hypothetical protein